ncbi:hypothetical protein TD95_001943 [Thielaviopsis punctulata]|uniref:Ubiquitin-activating enzyme E1-like n=1 Tax=Thielaviopsis punctulata TaxID=72032 RepID=A0A0F4ZFQ3_9PEZI|nr:hypothetical protein TD95_001943 [Thielaviopsis punctulata]
MAAPALPQATAVPQSTTLAAEIVATTGFDRELQLKKAVGLSLVHKIKASRVLMVGAGGIGCELLKNLVMSGYYDIHIVDLDTIDLSNLNRQFLFRHEHIKKSKALVAKEVAQKFNPQCSITAYHANIKDAQFGIKWFKQFNLVFNALDNLDARRHVNRMCLAADIPLIESGTTGFNGQVQVIKKGVTACYDCTPKETPKTFPVCTIRSTPSQPIHCIVWGKSYLLNEIFGISEDESAFDNTENTDNSTEIAELRKEAKALKDIRNSAGKPEFARMLFTKVYTTDVQRLLSVEEMWKGKRAPVPLDFDGLATDAGKLHAAEVLRRGQDVWTPVENVVVFIDSLSRLSARMQQMRETNPNEAPCITFDKDDQDTLDFVAAAANLRAHVFGIALKSRFDIKQMAGNIIPAIATTNAVVAGLSVIQAMKVIQGHYDQVKEVFLTPFGANRVLAPDSSRPPNPECPVCGPFQTVASVDLERATLADLVESFVRADLGYGEKEIVVSNEVGPLYDVDEDENLGKKLSELGIKADSFLTVIDDDEEQPFVNVIINIQPSDPGQEKPVAVLGSPPQIPFKPKSEPVAEAAAEDDGDDGDVMVASDTASAAAGTKRRHEDNDDVVEVVESKKAKTEEGGAVEVVDEDDGVIVID